MRRLAAAVAVLMCALAARARADDPVIPDDPTPEGTWKWSFERNGETSELAVKLKYVGDELTGSFVGRDGKEAPIKDAQFKGSELSFIVTREFKGKTFAIKYEGVLVGDTITGSTVFDVLTEKRFRTWEAKRVAGSFGPLGGSWKFVLNSPLGEVERSIKLKQDGEKLTGTLTHERGEAQIKDGKAKGADFSFAVTIEQNGKPVRFKYSGKKEGPRVKGAVEYDVAGETGKLDFTGERVKRSAATSASK